MTRHDYLRGLPRPMLIEILLAGFCLELLSLAMAVFTQAVFDKVIVHNSVNTLGVLGAGMIVLVAVEGVMLYLYLRHVHHFGAIAEAVLARPAMLKLLSLSLQQIESMPKGAVAAHLRSIKELRQLLSAFSVTAAIDAAFLVLVVILFALYSPLLAAVVLACVPVLALFSVALRTLVRTRHERLLAAHHEFEALIHEGLQAMPTIKTMALEEFWRGRWLGAHSRYMLDSLEAKKVDAIEETVIRVLNRSVTIAVLWVGAVEVMTNKLSMGQLIACYLFTAKVLTPSARLFQVSMGFTRLREVRTQLQATLERQGENDEGGAEDCYPGGPVRLRNLSYSFPTGRAPVLQNIELHLDPATFIAIVGASGSGKSTLARLIQGHLRPTHGEVLVGGVPIEHIGPSALRSNVLTVTQDAVVFRASVRENVLCGRELDRQWFVACLEAAEAADFVRRLPKGARTTLDEKALVLSSGQRQRLNVARALYGRPQVLILDEATNALDAPTEGKVLRNIRRLLPDVTLIVVTHRWHNLPAPDRILRMQDGELSELAPKAMPVDAGESRHGT